MCRNNVKGAKTRDRLKAQTTIFGGFDYDGVRIDYGKDGGLRSGFSNTLAVGEDKSVLYPVGFPLRNFRFVSGGNYYSQDYLTHYFGEDGKSRICEKIKCDGDKQSPGDVRISRGPNETGHQKNEIDFEPFKYNYALPPLVVSTVDGVAEILHQNDHNHTRPYLLNGKWVCAPGSIWLAVKVSLKNTSNVTIIYGHLDPKTEELAMWDNNSRAVVRGDIIGFLGNTGCSTGPHLHYSISEYSIEDFYSSLTNNLGLGKLPEDIVIYNKAGADEYINKYLVQNFVEINYNF